MIIYEQYQIVASAIISSVISYSTRLSCNCKNFPWKQGIKIWVIKMTIKEIKLVRNAKIVFYGSPVEINEGC